MAVSLSAIFDMDGVIFDSERALLGCWIDVAAEIGISAEQLKAVHPRCIGCNRNQDLATLDGAFGKGAGEHILVRGHDLMARRYDNGRLLPVKPGARELLSWLKARGIRMGLATSTRSQTARTELESAGLLSFFESVTGGESVLISKPDPQIYLIACDALGVEPSQAFAVEDSFNGIRSSYAAGMRPIMVPDILQPDEEMRSLAEAICPDLFAVRDYLSDKL